MIANIWLYFALIVLVLAYLSAAYHRQHGYPFWRTFILAVMGFAGLGLLIVKMIVSS